MPMRFKRPAFSLAVSFACAFLSLLPANGMRATLIPVADVPCSSEFELENVHYMRGPSGELGCVGDVVAAAGVPGTLQIASVRFDRMESAVLHNSDLYLNGSGSLKALDPLSSETPRSDMRFKRLTVIVRSDDFAQAEPEQPAPPPIPRLRRIGSGPRQWPRLQARASAPSRRSRIVVTEEPWGMRATSKNFSGCLSLAEKVQRAKRGNARLRLSNFEDYKTSRFAVVQYHNQSGAAVILNRVEILGSGSALTCAADFAVD